MAQNFNPEAHALIKATHAELQDGAFKKLPAAMDLVAEQAKRSGAPALIASCENAVEVGIPALTQAFEQLMESIDEYLVKAKSLCDALGYDA